jgi:protein LTV1
MQKSNHFEHSIKQNIKLSFFFRGEGDEEDESDEDGSWMDDSDADSGDLNSSDGDSVPSLKGMRMKNEDMKSSRFTEYSMSSSVMRRNDQLTLLDDRFEQVRYYQTSLQ